MAKSQQTRLPTQENVQSQYCVYPSYAWNCSFLFNFIKFFEVHSLCWKLGICLSEYLILSFQYKQEHANILKRISSCTTNSTTKQSSFATLSHLMVLSYETTTLTLWATWPIYFSGMPASLWYKETSFLYWLYPYLQNYSNLFPRFNFTEILFNER